MILGNENVTFNDAGGTLPTRLYSIPPYYTGNGLGGINGLGQSYVYCVQTNIIIIGQYAKNITTGIKPQLQVVALTPRLTIG